MATSANIKNGGVVTFSIKVGGNPIPDGLSVISIEVENFVNKIPLARIVLIDGDISTGKFEASSSSVFLPGKPIVIEAGYDSQNNTIFQGIITRQSVRANEHQGTTLEVECRDKAIKLIVGRKSATYAQQKDSDIISSIISANGLSANVSATATTWPDQVQYYCTDWDFIVSRAEVNCMVVTIQNGTVTVASPTADTSSIATIALGDGLLEFSADMDATFQLETVKASSWDYKQQAVISEETSNSGGAGPGNLSSKKLSSVIGLSDYQLQTQATLTSEELKTWGQAQILKSQLARIRGEAKFAGSYFIVPGKYITIQGVGDRFNGDYYISGVVQEISDGNWTTETKFGLPFQWFIEAFDVVQPAAAGLLPAVGGIFSGTVKKIFGDPDSQYRIQVNMPVFGDSEGIWARLANFYSTSGAGAFFLPEVGDEVIIAFLNDDPRYPVILGSVYSDANNKPFSQLQPADKNPLKAIVSKTGIYIQFDDEHKILTANTPASNKVVLSDQDKQITIQDQNGNKIILSSDGIELSTDKNIKITAGQSISMSGQNGITLESAAGDVSIKGLNVKQEAQVEYSAKGDTSASVQGGANLTLKGGMVMIN